MADAVVVVPPRADTGARHEGPTLIDLYASAAHYAAHLLPIWRELQRRGVAGSTYSARASQEWRDAALPRRDALRATQPVLVASHVDYQAMSPRPVVYVEHGAGQSYDGDPRSAGHGSYSGGKGLDRVVLFIGPSEHVSARWRERYPSTPAVAVGCPKLDARFSRLSERARAYDERRVAAITFHWDCALVAESTSAWRHFDRALPGLVSWAREHDVELLGHGHPRLWRTIAPRWRALGVEPVESFDAVLDRADVLVFDNSSAGYEFASLDRPVVVLNAPWYRRDVEHGGRFWQCADVGVQCDEPHELIAAVERALLDEPTVRANRERIVSQVYSMRDGRASSRAADAICDALRRLDFPV